MPTIDEIISSIEIDTNSNYDHLRAAIESAISEARAEERERCARECMQTDADGEGPDCWDWHSKDYASAIRALKD